MRSTPIPSRCLSPGIVLLLLYLWVVPAAIAQVSVAPTALFLSNQERFGAVYIANQSTAPQEVTIGFRFGYPAADSVGNLFMQYEDSTTAAKFSIAEHIRAFPQRFILPPGETQVVRLSARLPADAPDGTYWSRVVVTSTPQVPFDDSTTTGIRTRVLFRLQQITALFFRKGETEVSIDLADLAASYDTTGVALTARIGYEGNTPFLGSAIVRVFDEGGKLLQEQEQTIAVYIPEERRFTLALQDASPGSYEAELTLTPRRTDIPQEQVLHTEPVTRRVRFKIE